jgi:hypothetical protein
MQPVISCGLCTCPSFTPSSEDGMGGDNFPRVRSPNRHMQGRRTHLPEYKRVCSDMIKFTLLLLLYRFLQVTHRLTSPDVDGEGLIGRAENPTEEGELVI